MPIDEICYKYDIRNYTINDGGSIDVDGVVDLSRYELTKLPLKFNRVSGDFYCDNNNLTDLKGSPENIGGDFYCGGNPISSIAGKMDIDFIRAINTFKVIKDKTINLKRLRYVMEMFDKPVDLERIKKYYKVI